MYARVVYRHIIVLKAGISSLPSVPAIVTISQVDQSVIQLQLTPVNHTTTTNDLTAEMSHNNTLIPLLEPRPGITTICMRPKPGNIYFSIYLVVVCCRK